ncbi:MAG: hypothetical protein R3C01_09385 [Planctomycetaceae bacterium]
MEGVEGKIEFAMGEKGGDAMFFMDVAFDDKAHKRMVIYQIGDVNDKRGDPIARERRVMEEVEKWRQSHDDYKHYTFEYWFQPKSGGPPQRVFPNGPGWNPVPRPNAGPK